MRLVQIRRTESARRARPAGITLSTLKLNPRSSGLFGHLSNHVNHFVTS